MATSGSIEMAPPRGCSCGERYCMHPNISRPLRVPCLRQMSPRTLRRIPQPLVGDRKATATAGMAQINPPPPWAIVCLRTSSPGEVPTFSMCGYGRPQMLRAIRVGSFRPTGNCGGSFFGAPRYSLTLSNFAFSYPRECHLLR